MPTPNGPLHVGHIAGPYLKMDVIARFLRREGHAVATVSATDPYETHVLPKAMQLGMSPPEVCARFHAEIDRGLRCLDIEYDRFIDPLSPRHNERLRQLTAATLEQFFTKGLITIREENVPYSTRFDWPILGSFIGGTCPVCGVPDAGGFHCEQCGAENSPEELLDVRSEIEGDRWEWRCFRSAFLVVDAPDRLVALLNDMGVDPALLHAACRQLQRSGSRIRISHPGHWGIRCDLPGVSPGSVVFTYSALFTLSLLCGEIGAALLGEALSPFQHPSNVVTVKSFGFDNVVPYFVSVTGQALAGDQARPFSRFLTNYFCTLDGEKFSTSREHAIWAHDALQQLDTSADLLRLYLSACAPDAGAFDFSTSRFKVFRDMAAPKLRRVQNGAPTAGGGDLRPADRRFLHQLLSEQRECLDPATLNVRRAAEGVLAWLARGDAQEQTRSWTRALAVLAWPIMPRLSESIWRATGLGGTPIAREVDTDDDRPYHRLQADWNVPSQC
jgi:methionyl-tRNA synthetase